MKIALNNKAFTLIEVMIAMAIFAVFATAFITSMGYSITSSGTMKLEAQLKNICQYKINEIIEEPPEFKESLTLKKETGNFKEEEFEGFKFEIEYKQFLIPDLAKIKGSSEEEDPNSSQLEGKLFQTIKDNMEKMLWQVEVNIIHIDSGRNFSLSTWLYDSTVDVQIQAI